LFDAAVGYDFKALSREYDGIKARLTASNLFDKSYVAACNGYGTCSFGKGREVLLKLSYTW
jgi:iron complex outermembrane receptor protein